MRQTYSYSLIVVLVACAWSGCITTKTSKADTGWLKRQIHDVNARYNGYFNAKELYTKSYDQLVSTHSDDYNQILPIYPLGSEEDRTAIEEDMDLAIEKVVKVASLHEPSKWVDDCYVMMGKAQYLQGDLETAEETLEYFVEDFNPADPSSRVYVSPVKKKGAKEKRREAQKRQEDKKKELKDANKQREKERKERKKKLEEERKQRQKERDQRRKDLKKGKKVAPIKRPTTKESPRDTITAIADTTSELLDPDEAYLRDVEAKEQERQAAADKLKRQGQKGGFLKHKPSYQEGRYWLVRTLIARGKWIEANYFLTELENNPDLRKDILDKVTVARAAYFLGQKDYISAIDALQKALETSHDRRIKARMAYILAQAYQLSGQAKLASEAYAKVSKYKTSYEMKINAEINQIKNLYAASELSTDQVIKRFGRMAAQDKNRQYQGPIYAAQAEMQLISGDQAGAMESFAKALETSSNKNVKGDIYYRLSDIFFGKGEYRDAKLYIDSALVVINEKDPRFRIGQQRSNNLKEIVRNINVIETQDSLLKIASMSDKDLEQYARKKATDKWKAQQSSTSKEAQAGGSTALFGTESKFFAYNNTLKIKGRLEFKKKWGDRPLTDNWRRASAVDDFIETQESIAEQSDQIPDNLLKDEMDKIIRDLPTSDEQRANAEKSIEEATFALGTGYRTYLEDYKKSNITLLQLLDRYPKTEHKPEALYFLYLNFLDLDRPDQAESYKIRLIREFPNSSFAKYLKDPTNSDALITEEREISLFYDETYKFFERGAYQKTYDRLISSEKRYGKDHFMTPKFELLKAMCIGHTQSKNDYIDALRGIVLRYENTPEQTYARELLRFLKGDQESFGKEVTEEDLAKYVIEDDRLHYVMLVSYDSNNAKNREIKTKIQEFNERSFADKRLKVSNIILNKENNSYVFLIRRFPNKKEAMAFYRKASTDKTFLDQKKFSYDIYAINQKNYRKVSQERAVGAYKRFFDKNYLGIK